MENCQPFEKSVELQGFHRIIDSAFNSEQFLEPPQKLIETRRSPFFCLENKIPSFSIRNFKKTLRMRKYGLPTCTKKDPILTWMVEELSSNSYRELDLLRGRARPPGAPTR